MGKRGHKEMRTLKLEKPFGSEIRGLKPTHLQATTCPQRGRPQKVDKEKKFAYLLYIPVQLYDSLAQYINHFAQRKENVRSIILAGLEVELLDLKAGKIKDEYQSVEKSSSVEPRYLLNIPIATNRVLDELVKALSQDGITKRSIILVGLKKKLRQLHGNVADA